MSNNKQKWQIFVVKGKDKGEKQKIMTLYGYESREVALEETLLYQFALMRDHAKGWVSLQEKSVRLTLGNPIRNISYLEGLRVKSIIVANYLLINLNTYQNSTSDFR